jgi:hypothetical protein
VDTDKLMDKLVINSIIFMFYVSLKEQCNIFMLKMSIIICPTTCYNTHFDAIPMTLWGDEVRSAWEKCHMLKYTV